MCPHKKDIKHIDRTIHSVACVMHKWCDPREGTLILSYIRRLRSFFWVQNFEFQYFLGVFRKINTFLGMTILWMFFGSSQKWTIFRGYFYVF